MGIEDHTHHILTDDRRVPASWAAPLGHDVADGIWPPNDVAEPVSASPRGASSSTLPTPPMADSRRRISRCQFLVSGTPTTVDLGVECDMPNAYRQPAGLPPVLHSDAENLYPVRLGSAC